MQALLCVDEDSSQASLNTSLSCTEQKDRSELSLETAMRVYNLKESELLWEKATDTKLLMAWNEHIMILAFRGTATVSNALADLQVHCSFCSMSAFNSLSYHCCVQSLEAMVYAALFWGEWEPSFQFIERSCAYVKAAGDLLPVLPIHSQSSGCFI